MARKKIGHIELQWTCPNCNGINPGSEKTCGSCGAPQPEDVVFEQAERQEIITDEEKIAQAEAGADIHCPYCGTRNPAGTEVCSNCGGDLVEGMVRESGRVVGAYKTGPAAQINPPSGFKYVQRAVAGRAGDTRFFDHFLSNRVKTQGGHGFSLDGYRGHIQVYRHRN